MSDLAFSDSGLTIFLCQHFKNILQIDFQLRDRNSHISLKRSKCFEDEQNS